ncbi:protein of unknown function [Candidatus Methylomirabilis oxygeniifera]|uniref:Uncharacterized protein n=1 Tax=Methylomirabilis oxygeniifera TaxID=671143 RepID=D5MKW4_METO1|nr:protein of unknown function [Candidatus Methylomirabilis oxyfera]
MAPLKVKNLGTLQRIERGFHGLRAVAPLKVEPDWAGLVEKHEVSTASEPWPH